MSNIYREFGVDVLRDSENAGPTAAEVRMAQEIERLRARVAELERDDRLPRQPEELVGALNDRIHPASGRLLNATPIHAKLKEAKP